MSAPALGLRRAAAAVFLAAALVRACGLLAQGPEPRFALSADSHGYGRLAVNLRERAVFSFDEDEPFTPDTVRTPGYPVFLSLFRGPRPALWWQAALGAAACALVVLAAGALGASAPAAAAAGLLLSADFVSVLFTGQVLTDVHYQLLVALALYLAASGRFARAGLVAGLGALFRPVGLYLPVVLSAVVCAVNPRGARLRQAAVVLLCGFLLPAAWIARNKVRSGTATFSSIQGLNALLRAGVVNAEVTGKPYSEAYAQLENELRVEHPKFATQAEEAQAAGRLAARFIARHPFAYLKVCFKDVFKLLGGTGLDVFLWAVVKDPRYDPMGPDVESGGFKGTRQQLARHPKLKLVLAGYWSFLLAAYFLAARGAWRLYRERRWDPLLVAGVPLLYFLALTLGMGAYYRLRLPLMPPLLILAAFGL